MGSSIGSPLSSSAVVSSGLSMLMLSPARSNSPTSADSIGLGAVHPHCASEHDKRRRVTIGYRKLGPLALARRRSQT